MHCNLARVKIEDSAVPQASTAHGFFAHDQSCAPFVTWHSASGASKVSVNRAVWLPRLSASEVHLSSRSTLWPWVRVQKLDVLSMKYTNWTCRLMVPLLAPFPLPCALPSFAQS